MLLELHVFSLRVLWRQISCTSSGQSHTLIFCLHCSAPAHTAHCLRQIIKPWDERPYGSTSSPPFDGNLEYCKTCGALYILSAAKTHYWLTISPTLSISRTLSKSREWVTFLPFANVSKRGDVSVPSDGLCKTVQSFERAGV